MKIGKLLIITVGAVVLAACGGGGSSSSSKPAPVTPPVVLTFKFATTSLPDAVQGLPYSQTIAVSNGTPPFTWSLVSGVLPSGFSLNSSNGLISGTTNDNATGYSFRIRVVDSSNPVKTIEQDFTPLFNLRLPLQAHDMSLAFIKGANMGRSLDYNGGVPPYTVQLVSGSLPPGLNLSTTTVSGIATQLGTYSSAVRIRDSYVSPEEKTINLSFTVNEPIPIVRAELPHAFVGVVYSYHFAAFGGALPLSFSSSGLPGGFALASDGTLTGTPTAAGTVNLPIKVTDSSPTPQSSTVNVPLRVLMTPLGRNDSIATATPLSSGLFNATISPYANASGVAHPDEDYYKIVVAPSATASVRVDPVDINSKIDPVMEFVDANGTRLLICQTLGGTGFTSPCMNDDIDPGNILASQLLIQNTSASDLTVYVHIRDYTGGARPDFKYQLAINGAK